MCELRKVLIAPLGLLATGKFGRYKARNRVLKPLSEVDLVIGKRLHVTDDLYPLDDTNLELRERLITIPGA
jgi:hypothetical protein